MSYAELRELYGTGKKSYAKIDEMLADVEKYVWRPLDRELFDSQLALNLAKWEQYIIFQYIRRDNRGIAAVEAFLFFRKNEYRVLFGTDVSSCTFKDYLSQVNWDSFDYFQACAEELDAAGFPSKSVLIHFAENRSSEFTKCYSQQAWLYFFTEGHRNVTPPEHLKLKR